MTTYQIPEGFEIENIERNDLSYNSPMGSYTANTKTDNNNLTIQSTLTRNNGRFSPKSADEFKQFNTSINAPKKTNSCS